MSKLLTIRILGMYDSVMMMVATVIIVPETSEFTSTQESNAPSHLWERKIMCEAVCLQLVYYVPTCLYFNIK